MSGRKHRHMENRILRDYFGTERNLQEKQSVSVCDGYTDIETIELGTRPIPKWIWQELNQAIDHLVEGTFPIFVAHEKGTLYDDSIVMMRLSDYVQHVRPHINSSSPTQDESEEINKATHLCISSDESKVEKNKTDEHIHALRLFGFVLCTCGEYLHTFEQVKEHRRRGCYDD